MQRILNHMRIRILVIGLLWAISLQANVLPDSLWTFKHVNEHHNSSENEIWLSADRPGEGTGSEVLSKGLIQWETGFEVLHAFNAHFLTLPSTLFRFGLHKRFELRMEYTGSMFINDHPDSDPLSPDEHLYTPSPLLIGTKILICDHRGGKLDQPWIPRTALLCNIGLPISKLLAEMMPVSGSVDLLFENEITEWLSLGYDVGVQWNDWAPAPDIFASLGINFEPTDHLGLFVESFNLFDPNAYNFSMDKKYTHYYINMDFGITYAVHPRVQLDAYAGFNIYNSEPAISFPQNYAFFGLGVTWLICNL